MTGKYDVYVYPNPAPDPNIGNNYLVQPGVALGTPGDSVRFRNLTEYKVYLTFPDDLIREGPNQTIDPHKRSTFHIGDNADGFYSYKLEVDGPKKRQRAYGGSDPGMIIDA